MQFREAGSHHTGGELGRWSGTGQVMVVMATQSGKAVFAGKGSICRQGQVMVAMATGSHVAGWLTGVQAAKHPGRKQSSHMCQQMSGQLPRLLRGPVFLAALRTK